MRGFVGTEVPLVSGRYVGFTRDTAKVIVGLGGKSLSVPSGDDNLLLLARRAICEDGIPFIVGAPGDGGIARELDPGKPLNSGVQVLWCAITIDVSEEARRFDGVVSGARLGEVGVRSGNWRPFYEITRATESIHLRS